MALVGEKKKKKHGQNIENGVMITVYVESSRSRSSNKSSKKTKPQRESKTRRGCDRKAQLLAYSRHLRNMEASQNVQVQTQPKFKANSLFSSMVALCCHICGYAANFYIVIKCRQMWLMRPQLHL